jgi:outer membrane protein insertion porin family
VRIPYNADGTLQELDVNKFYNEAIGGRAFYLGRIELQPPVSSTLKNYGLRPSIYADVGSLWGIRQPNLTNILKTCTATNLPSQVIDGDATNTSCTQFNVNGVTAYSDASSVPGFKEEFLGNSPKPRVSVGVGVNWISPFGPLRLDIAKALVFQKGDDPKLFTFNVGTQF